MFHQFLVISKSRAFLGLKVLTKDPNSLFRITLFFFFKTFSFTKNKFTLFSLKKINCSFGMFSILFRSRSYTIIGDCLDFLFSTKSETIFWIFWKEFSSSEW